MTDLINRITDAIFRKEGAPLTARNPGNLRDCPWFPACVIWTRPNGSSVIVLPNGMDHTPGAIALHTRRYPDGATAEYRDGFWMPRTRAEGVAGAVHCVALRIAEGQTLAQLITGWAPPNENNTAKYIAQVKEWASIPDENVPLWNFIE